MTRAKIPRGKLALVALTLCTWARVASVASADAADADSNIAALATDGERLFVGTFDEGLRERWPDGSLQLVGPALEPNVNALAVDRVGGVLWVGTAHGLLRCLLSRVLSCRRFGASGAIHALLLLRDGMLLAGGEGRLLTVSRAGTTRLLDKKHGAPFRAVWSLAEADDGSVFVGTTNGLYFASLTHWFDGTTAPGRVAMVTGDLPDDWVTALSILGDTLRVGTYHAGLVTFRFDDARLVRQSSDSALGYVNPAGLLPLPEGQLAVATMNGLRIGTDGAYRTIQTPARDVTAILARGAGRYWVATRAGLVSLSLLPGRSRPGFPPSCEAAIPSTPSSGSSRSAQVPGSTTQRRADLTRLLF